MNRLFLAVILSIATLSLCMFVVMQPTKPVFKQLRILDELSFPKAKSKTFVQRNDDHSITFRTVVLTQTIPAAAALIEVTPSVLDAPLQTSHQLLEAVEDSSNQQRFAIVTTDQSKHLQHLLDTTLIQTVVFMPVVVYSMQALVVLALFGALFSGRVVDAIYVSVFGLLQGVGFVVIHYIYMFKALPETLGWLPVIMV